LQKSDENIKEINVQCDPRWELVGFQGKTPQSDFRGLDMLSLRSMLWFGHTYHRYSRSILYQTHKNDRSNNWFSYYITGIHLIFDLYQWFTGYDINEYSTFYKSKSSSSQSSSDKSWRKIINVWNPNNAFMCEWYLQQFVMKKNGIFLKRYEYLRNMIQDRDVSTQEKDEEKDDPNNSNTYSEEFFQEFQFDCDHITDLRLSVVSQFFSSYYVWFHEYWQKVKPKTIMEFNMVHKKFKNNLKASLQNNEEFSILKDRDQKVDIAKGILIDDEKEILKTTSEVYQLYSWKKE